MEPFKPTVMVTGSEGSLGRAIIAELLKLGKYDIFGVDNLYKGQSLSPMANTKYRFFYADLSNWQSVSGIYMAKHFPSHFDYVIHCAAKIYGIGGFNKHATEILFDDPRSTMNALKMFAGNQTNRFVYISSSMVYENIHDTWDLVEEDVERYPAPITEYGLSKFIGERMVKSFCAREFTPPYTIWRPFNIITPFEKAGEEQGTAHVFADFMKKLIVEDSSVLPIIGDGQQVRCFTHIDDVAYGIVNFMECPETENQIFNIGNKEPVTMLELADLIVKIGFSAGVRSDLSYSVVSTKNYEHDVKKRIPNVDKLTQKLKWVPETSLKESLSKCVEYIKLLKQQPPDDWCGECEECDCA